MKTPTLNGNHKGEVTHHQDQSILLVNFNPKNNRKRRLKKPTPFDLLFAIVLNLDYKCK